MIFILLYLIKLFFLGGLYMNLLFRSALVFCGLFTATAALTSPSVQAQDIGIGTGEITLPDQLVLECMMLDTASDTTYYTFVKLAQEVLKSHSANSRDRQEFIQAITGSGQMNCHRIVQLMRYKNHLDLSNTGIRDLSLLAHMHQLRSLRLDNNRIVDLSPLANLDNLETLTVSNNTIKHVDVLAQMRNLKFLDLRRTLVTQAAPLAYSTSLVRVDLRNSAVSDIAEARQIADDIRSRPQPNPPVDGSSSVVFPSRTISFAGP